MARKKRRKKAKPSPKNKALWSRVKGEVKRSPKGGPKGKWSARKAQRAVGIYKRRGGGYSGSKAGSSLKRWGAQKWTATSGGNSKKGRRKAYGYLPKSVVDSLTPAQKAAMTRAKRSPGRTKYPPSVAKKMKRRR